MFEAAFESSEPVEEFSTWLLVGTAAVASFALINAEKLAPFIGGQGFLVCGVLLSLSSLLGLLSKVMAVQCKVQIRTSTAVRKTFAEHLERHRTEEEKIEQGASTWGLALETHVRIERILNEFFSVLPKWIQWLARRRLSKDAGNPQIGHLMVMRILMRQGMFAALQAVAFVAFLVAGFVYAAISPAAALLSS